MLRSACPLLQEADGLLEEPRPELLPLLGARAERGAGEAGTRSCRRAGAYALPPPEGLEGSTLLPSQSATYEYA